MRHRAWLVALAAILVIATAVVFLSRQRVWSGRAGGSDREAPAEGTGPRVEPTGVPATVAAPAAPWRLLVTVREASGAPIWASVYLTNEAGDLVERVDGEAGDEMGFDASGIVGVRVIGERDLAPAVVEGITAPPGTEKRLTVTLERGLSIWGRVLEPTGELWLITNRVYAEPLDAPWNVVRGRGWEADSWGDGRWLTYDTGVSSDGSFNLSGLVPGRYRVSVSCDATRKYCPRDKAQTVEAGATGVEIHLVRQACVRLRFLDSATGGPVRPYAQFELTGGADREWRVVGGSDDAGECALWLDPGSEATLRVEADGYFAHESVPIVGGGSGEETEVVCELHPDPGVWADLDVLLRDEDGALITDMVVWQEGRLWVSVTGNDQGLYRLRVPAGSWHIVALADYDAIQELRTFWLPLRQEVRLERGEHARREWTVRRGGLIVVRGDVEREPWLSVDGRRVEDAPPTRTPTLEWSDGRAITKPPAYMFVVAPGAYRVETRSGGRRASLAAEARTGGITEVTFAATAVR